ncbi:hypothetical protein ABT336_13135 [Micromonospora sp. NPDC000207]|uniref:hypothetical protein n=1 Tax=Micromonospora sp. NPDC000207 TaxID=3154246 RepID=UPI00332A72F0
MTGCGVWLSAEFLTRHGFQVVFRPDGRVTASRDEVTHLLPGACGHAPADCPPPAETSKHDERMEVAA